MKLSVRLLLWGGFLGAGLLWGIISYWPDGKLHVVFCDVGQGDAIYIKMPNTADMLIDGGPNDRVLNCLGRQMPFYDRTLEIVLMTHPQKDHLQGLVSVLQRYKVGHFITVPVRNETQAYKALRAQIKDLNLPVRYLYANQSLKFGKVAVTSIWPDRLWLEEVLKSEHQSLAKLDQNNTAGDILGFSTDLDLNLFSIYLHLNFGNFDLLLTGDGDQKTQEQILNRHLTDMLPQQLEILKVPHHGSRTALTDEFLKLIQPQLSVIEVGKNSYGHPNQNTISQLLKFGDVLRTDNSGDIEVISDGKSWRVKTKRKTPLL